MIPNATDRTITGNLTGDKVRMSFDESSLAHIMSILTDLYSDPELAVVREYSTNALDSHREAGISDPIEVTLPSPLSPYLKIRDHGVGLSVDDIHEIYSKYGASTKRGSNDATGMLGLGCKSALTYSAQFTLTTVKDGARATVAISRDEDGAGSMTIVDTAATDARNGVEISIPAKSGNHIESKAKEFFKFWEPGTVLVNGEEPKPVEGLQITPELTLLKSSGYYDRSSHVVMGNVPYPDDEVLTPSELQVPYGYVIIARVPIGSVDFAPSREHLQYTKRTKEALTKVARVFRSALVDSVQREIEQAPDRPSALAAYKQWSKLVSQNTFRYRGREIKTSLKPAPRADDGTPGRILVTSSQNYRLSASSKTTVIDLDYMVNAVFVTDYDLTKMTATHKKKMLQWLEKQDFGANFFCLVDFPLDKTWLDEKRIVSWQTVNAEILPRNARTASGRLAGSYDTFVKGPSITNPIQYEVPGDKIDFTNPVYYIHGNVRGGYSYASFPESQNISAFTIICLPANRIAKFARENPKIQCVSDVIKAAFVKWEKSLTSQQKLALKIEGSYGEARRLSVLVGYKILDPSVNAAIKAAKTDVSNLVTKEREFTRWGFYFSNDAEWESPLDEYPLFSEYNLDESVEYMNLVWQSKQSS